MSKHTFIKFHEYSYKSVDAGYSLLFYAPSSPWTDGYPDINELLIITMLKVSFDSFRSNL